MLRNLLEPRSERLVGPELRAMVNGGSKLL